MSRSLSLSLAEVAAEEVEHLGPGIHRLLLPVHRPVVVPEAVAGAVVAVELVLLAMLLELGLMRVDLLRGGALVLVAEEAQKRTGQVFRVLDRRHRTLRRDLL